MKNNVIASSGWIVATFSLLALCLLSVTTTFETNTDPVEEERVLNRVSADPFLGEITMFGGNFAPRGWAKCDGQLLQIAQYSALFSLLGTTYGGDGRTTFALPDLRGRVPVHNGTGPGLSTYSLGTKGGAETFTLPTGVSVQANRQGKVTAVTSGKKISNLQPYNTVNFIIALQGTYPSRN